MGNEASSVEAVSPPKEPNNGFPPLFPTSSSASIKFPPSVSSTLRTSKLNSSRDKSTARSGKKTIHEINQHITNLHSYQQSKQEKLQKQREQATLDKQCTFQPKLNTVRSASPRSFHQFYKDQQRYQQEKERSLERERKSKQQQKQNAQKEQLDKNRKSTSRQRTNQLVDKLYDSKKNSSISKPSKNSKDSSMNSKSNSKKRYVPSHQIIVNGPKSKGEELYSTFKKKMEEKTTVPSLPPKQATPTGSNQSEKVRCQRLIKDFEEAVGRVAQDTERLSYVEFSEMLLKVGFIGQTDKPAANISPTLAKERAMVYEAWRHLQIDQAVHSQDLLSFVFAVMGSDLQRYYGGSTPSANDSFRSRNTAKLPAKESKFSRKTPPDQDQLFLDDQLSKQSAPNRLSHTDNGFGGHPYERSEQEYGNSAPSVWENYRPSQLDELGYRENSRLFYRKADIEVLKKHFSEFYVNRLHSSRGKPVDKSKSPKAKQLPKSPSVERKRAADEQMFQTRKARILEQAVQLGIIGDAEGISHAEYLSISKKVELRKRQQEKEKAAKQEMRYATFRPKTNQFQATEQEYIKERLQYTPSERNTPKKSKLTKTQPSSNKLVLNNEQQQSRPIVAASNNKPVPESASKSTKKLPIRYGMPPIIKCQEYDDIESKPTADELPMLRTDRSEQEEYQTELLKKAQNKQQPYPPKPLDPILHVDIRLNSRQVERISLRLNDDPYQAAVGFIQRYRLDPNLAPKLTQVIQSNIEKVREDSTR